MSTTHTQVLTPRKPLRLWPGVAAVVVQWSLLLVAPLVGPDTAIIGVLGGVGCGLVVLAWWLFFSRARWSERIGVFVLMIVAVAVAKRMVHASISNGMMGMMLPIYSIPVLSLALVVAAVVSRHLSSGARRASFVGAIALAFAVFMIVRTDGVTGAGSSDLHWRWTPTAEQRLLAQAASHPMPPPPAPPSTPAPTVVPTPVPTPAATSATIPATSAEAPPSPSPVAVDAKTTAAWPGFRGPARDSAVRGVRIDTDWSRKPPVELWHRSIGPGWSSFAVHGDLIYTQEQRGDDEMVSCYRLSTGEPVWAHRDPVRFYESNGGAGPRATPTLQHGRVYSFGATGIVNALDAATGRLIWSRNAATDTSKAVPGWGFASSPLVIGDLVIIAVSGHLTAYDSATGTPRWRGPTRGGGYSSPHLATIDGVPQVILLSGGGAMSVAPADGTLLWEHSWEPGVGIVQPAVVDAGVLISGGDGMGGVGVRRLAIARGPAGWTVDARWSSRGLKPYFNDYVVHKGHAYGVDGTILAAIDLSDGTRKWKGGRYGAGQVILLPDQDVLLVLSEEGELALVAATPDKFTELARAPALEGKTWNHPVLVGDILLVRNGEEMAAFRLATTAR